MSKQTRHYCTYCGRKRNESEMIQVQYKLLQKIAWHCRSHLSANADILHICNSTEKGVFLELFSGSKIVSSVASEYGYKPYTIDIESKFNPDRSADIRTVKLNELPGSVNFIWASVPCTYFTIMNIGNNWERFNYAYRRYYYLPKTKEAKIALELLEKTLWLIERLKPQYYVIENPRGALRHMPQMRLIPFRHTVSYSDYGLDIYKPTDLFTNIPGLRLKKLKNMQASNYSTGLRDLPTSFERSKVPGLLIHSIMKQL